MYQSAFGITAPPFQLAADPSFYFDSSSHHQALARLRSWLIEKRRFVVVTGETGVGKTTLVRTLVSEFDPALLTVAHVVSTRLDADDLLNAASIAFGISEHGPDSEDVADDLLRFLLGLANQGRRAVLIVDEAQNVRGAAWDRLSDFATRKVPRGVKLQIWLVGQPELQEALESAASPPLRALVREMCCLEAMSCAETEAYVKHRLSKVGWKGTPGFGPGAFDEIFRWTQGVPRRINQLCNRLLMAKSLDPKMIMDAPGISVVASELMAEIGLDGDLRARVGRAAAESARAFSRASTSAPLVPRAAVGTGSERPGALLVVASDYGDHVKAGALLRALEARADEGHPGTPAARLLRIHDNDALAYCGRLYADLASTPHRLDLAVPEGPHDAIVVELMTAFDAALDRQRPGAVVVFDGTPSAFSCSTVARAKRIPTVHIGAGLRVSESFVTVAATRKLTDHLADLLFTTDAQSSQTLEAEGVSPERIHCVGSLAMDAIKFATSLRPKPSRYFQDRHGYALAVLSNPVNIENREALAQLTDIFLEVSRVIPVVWPMRSRLHLQLKKYHLGVCLPSDRVHRLPARPYVDYVALLRGASCVLTDSWNVQEEANGLKIPCLTVGVFPERAIAGASNLSVGLSRTLAVSAVWEYVLSGSGEGHVPFMWDGRAGSRIAGYLGAWNPASMPAAAVSAREADRTS